MLGCPCTLRRDPLVKKVYRLELGFESEMNLYVTDI